MHNGVVRGWSRKDHAGVTAIEITPDHDRIKALCAEIEQRPGIFRAFAEARGGLLHPGDDALFLVVAGDIRENVKPALADLLDRVKSEAMPPPQAGHLTPGRGRGSPGRQPIPNPAIT